MKIIDIMEIILEILNENNHPKYKEGDDASKFKEKMLNYIESHLNEHGIYLKEEDADFWETIFESICEADDPAGLVQEYIADPLR